jgi:hypothetical protein
LLAIDDDSFLAPCVVVIDAAHARAPSVTKRVYVSLDDAVVDARRSACVTPRRILMLS